MKTLPFLLLLILIGFGIGYSQDNDFGTKAGTFKDSRDSNLYRWVKIGEQTWMAENLAYLPAVSPSSDGSESSPFYYVYNYEGNSISDAKSKGNYASYGVLYNWEAAKIACPSGWHIPIDDEWKILEDYLGALPGKKMKSISEWPESGNGDNSSGFNARPGGARNYYGGFDDLGSFAGFWAASEGDASYAWHRDLYYDLDGVYRFSLGRSLGFSVRCIKDKALLAASTGYSQTAEEYLNRGDAKYDAKDYQGAIADYNSAIELNPENAKDYFNRGNTKFNLQDYRGAIVDYTKVINLNPENARAYNNRGNAKSNIKDIKGAIVDFNKAIELNPEYKTAYIYRGNAKLTIEDPIGAIADFTKAIEIDPGDAFAYYFRGYSKSYLLDYQGAIVDFTKAIEINSKYASAYFLRGLAKINLDQKDSGCLDLSKAGELGLADAYDAIRENCNK